MAAFLSAGRSACQGAGSMHSAVARVASCAPPRRQQQHRSSLSASSLDPPAAAGAPPHLDPGHQVAALDGHARLLVLAEQHAPHHHAHQRLNCLHHGRQSGTQGGGLSAGPGGAGGCGHCPAQARHLRGQVGPGGSLLQGFRLSTHVLLDLRGLGRAMGGGRGWRACAAQQQSGRCKARPQQSLAAPCPSWSSAHPCQCPREPHCAAFRVQGPGCSSAQTADLHINRAPAHGQQSWRMHDIAQRSGLHARPDRCPCPLQQLPAQQCASSASEAVAHVFGAHCWAARQRALLAPHSRLPVP